jgi:hypothetical protein
LANKLKPGQSITNKQVVDYLCKRYPEHQRHPNPIITSDYSANCKSGYIAQVGGGFTRRRPPLLFRISDNQYIKYEPETHGLWECVLINDKKKMKQV